MWDLIIGAIIGALTSIGTAIGVEYLRRPNLILSAETPALRNPHKPDAPVRVTRHLRVILFNKQLPWWAKWMVRAPALQCRATITFHHLDGRDVFGRAMSGRWASSPQPLPIPIEGPHGERSQINDVTRLTLESRIDVYPDESQILDIAARVDDDEECHGWNNETYFHDFWRNPNWKLGHERYLVKVIVTSSGQKCVGCFVIFNDVPRESFRLERAEPNEEERIKEH